MRRNSMHTPLKLMACGLLIGTLLTACGGGEGDAVPPPAATVVPDEASASPEAFTAWAKTQQPSETAEPLGMGSLVSAPASDTIEPSSLD
jgi:hypothetical protein